jgi:hypothetical protein
MKALRRMTRFIIRSSYLLDLVSVPVICGLMKMGYRMKDGIKQLTERRR